MMNKNKRGQGLPIRKIIGVILIVLALASVFMVFFKVDILKYLRNLPGYQVPQEDVEINVSELTDEQISASCPARIGGISNKKIYFCEGYGRSCKVRISSNLLFKGEGDTGEIVIDRFWLFGDDHIGAVNNGRISLIAEVLKEEGSKYEEDLPSNFEFIKNLDGSRFYTSNWICRNNIV